ncbi:tripartite tricarboxylate transporter substrate binding protein [Variovorax sp. J31P207]|uniref:Bug family tripartite tricarboxylate transporter substrate binding protein n=1 Tax=Variovorax sp. J31P207 TaxID=3053510 RepID=UPI002578DB30|nr:tripartite tricarboxylate transporter substrate binding protein [Variovorax sp. J31P207]MDM0069332.1 tripartite tricarboxylate transporter substrate binding protein [Variovorax sp. J31P207]
MMQATRRTFLQCAIASGCAFPALAQQTLSSSKPVRVVVGYPAGGDTDAMARLFADKLSTRFGQPFVVDNKPGAGGALANVEVARAASDGHTLLFTPNTFVLLPLVLKLSPSASYDVKSGYTPIIKTGSVTLIAVAHPGSGLQRLSDVVKAARSGKLTTYGSTGSGSPMQIAGEWFNREAGIKLEHVPYRGAAPLVTDVVAGHVSVGYLPLGVALPYIAAGQLTPLAVLDAKRTALAPNIPTFAESGYPRIVVTAWNGFMGPKNMPTDLVKLFNQHVNEVLRLPEVQQKLGTLGTVPAGGPPQALQATVVSDYEQLGLLVRQMGITAD